MGCDIHFFTEVKQQDGSWKHVEHELYTDRNYSLFAILANVRNGYGFAGAQTGEGYRPICEPRGLPADVSPEVEAISGDEDNYGHSHSWLTLAELKAYDWDQETKRCGIDGVWTESYRESAGSFLTDTIPKMEALGDHENVRAVFWFDN